MYTKSRTRKIYTTTKTEIYYSFKSNCWFAIYWDVENFCSKFHLCFEVGLFLLPYRSARWPPVGARSHSRSALL